MEKSPVRFAFNPLSSKYIVRKPRFRRVLELSETRVSGILDLPETQVFRVLDALALVN